jgi:hypothetical protein
MADEDWSRLSVERQAWLVCRDDAVRRTRRWFDVVTRIGHAGMGFRTAGHGTDLVNEARSERLAALQFAAKDLIPRLTPEDRAALAEHRVLPDWFGPELVRLAKPIEKQLRRR